MELAYEHMNEPELIRIEPEKVTADRVRQAIFYPANEHKLPLLVGLVREIGEGRIMIFVNMKREAEKVQDYLVANGIHAAAISGDVPQNKRQRMLSDFQEGELPVLIGTDVASRGLHIPDVEYVINYDLPQDAEDYVHRIGRTATSRRVRQCVEYGLRNLRHVAAGYRRITSATKFRLPITTRIRCRSSSNRKHVRANRSNAAAASLAVASSAGGQTPATATTLQSKTVRELAAHP